MRSPAIGAWWRGSSPWSRFTTAAVALLVAGVLVPEGWRLPGPVAPAPATTTTTVAEAAAFDFDAAEFLARWNAVVGTEAATAGLARDSYDVFAPTHAQLLFGPDGSPTWVITLLLDQATGMVTAVRAIAALPVEEEAFLGVGLVVVCVEIEDPDGATTLYAQLLDEILAAEGAASADGATGDASYFLALSTETQFLLEVTP